MIEAPTQPSVDAARQGAIAVFGLIGATIIAVVVAASTTTEIGGVTGFAVALAVLVAALRPLPVRSYIESLDPLPAAAIALFLLGALIPASTGIDIVRGISLDDFATLVALAMALIWMATNRSSWTVPRVAVPLLALIAWLLVTFVIVGPSLRALLVGPGRWSIYAVMLIAAISWFHDRRLRWWFVGVLIAIAGTQSLIAIWAYHADWLIDGFYVGIERFRWYEPLFDDVPGRATGLLGISSNFFGAYTLIPAFIALGAAVRSRSQWMSAALIAAFAVFAYAGILSYTRMTLVALLLGLIGYVVVARPYRVVPAVVVIVALAVVATPIVSRFQEGNNRQALAGEAGQTIFDNPFAGVGSGNYLDAELESGGDVITVTPHNSFLLQASESGIVGGLLLVIAVAAVLAAAWGGSIPRRAGPGVMATAAFAAMGAVLVQTMSNNLLHIPPVATQFWMVAAAGAAWALAAGGSWAQWLVTSLRPGTSQ